MKAIDYAAPKTLAEAVALLAKHGDQARILAGGTDIIVQLREGRRDADLLVDVKHIPEVNELTFDAAKGLRLGAAVPCYRIYEHAEIAKAYPGLIDAVVADRRHPDPEPGQRRRQPVQRLAGRRHDPAADRARGRLRHRRAGRARARCRSSSSAPRRAGPCWAGRVAGAACPAAAASRTPAPRYLRFIPRNEMDIAVVGVGVARDAGRRARRKCTAARIALAAVAPTPLLVPEAGRRPGGRRR